MADQSCFLNKLTNPRFAALAVSEECASFASQGGSLYGSQSWPRGAARRDVSCVTWCYLLLWRIRWRLLLLLLFLFFVQHLI